MNGRVVVREDIMRLSSRRPDGTPMYPGLWRFMWVKAGSVWHLLAIEPYPG